MLPIRAAPATRSFARAFSSTNASRDLSKLTLIGRLGAAPQSKTTSNGKEYFMYSIATNPPATQDANGKWVDGPTSWHNVFSFNENQHNNLRRLTKGALVYVEADLEMRGGGKDDNGQVEPARVLLRQLSLKNIQRGKEAATADE